MTQSLTAGAMPTRVYSNDQKLWTGMTQSEAQEEGSVTSAIFDFADTDKDGVISEDELNQYNTPSPEPVQNNEDSKEKTLFKQILTSLGIGSGISLVAALGGKLNEAKHIAGPSLFWGGAIGLVGIGLALYDYFTDKK